MAAQARPVKLHPEARAELEESVAFYRRRAGERWAQRFKDRVREGFQAIATNPKRYAPEKGLGDVRRIRLNQFPFSLLYTEKEDHVWVVAVAHGSRRPGYWKGRIA